MYYRIIIRNIHGYENSLYVTGILNYKTYYNIIYIYIPIYILNNINKKNVVSIF